MEVYEETGRSTVGNIVGRRPDVPQYLIDLYEGFYLLDADGFSGRRTVQSMRALLDEMEVTDRVERMRVIRLWRRMDAARSEAQEKDRENR